MQAIKDGSREVDWGDGYNTLQVEQAYLHSMVPATWVKKYGLEKATKMAMDKAEKFRRDKLADAEYFMGQLKYMHTMKDYAAWRRKAFFAFGMAMHPGMDAMSPMHGWKVYDPSIEPFTFGYEIYEHHKGESRAPDAYEMSVMKQQIRMYFVQTFGNFSR